MEISSQHQMNGWLQERYINPFRITDSACQWLSAFPCAVQHKPLPVVNRSVGKSLPQPRFVKNSPKRNLCAFDRVLPYDRIVSNHRTLRQIGLLFTAHSAPESCTCYLADERPASYFQAV